MQNMIVNKSLAEPGDIIFVRHGKADIAGHGIRQFQRRLSLSDSDWGHVGVVVSHNEIIEAQFGKKADVFDLAAWKCSRKKDESFLILRHPELSLSEKAPLVKDAAIYWHGEAYAARELFRVESVGPGRSICSSLALKILERAGLISHTRSRESAQILPGELADLLFSIGWVEVSETDEYFKEFAQFLPRTVSTLIRLEDQNRRMNDAMVGLGTLTAGVTGFLKFTTQSNYSVTLRNLAAGSGISTRAFLFSCFDYAFSEIIYLADLERNPSSNWKYRDRALSVREHCAHNTKAALDIYSDVLKHCVSEFSIIGAEIDSSRYNFAYFRKFSSRCERSEVCAENDGSQKLSEETAYLNAIEALLKLYFEISLVIYIFTGSHGIVPSIDQNDLTRRRSHIGALKEDSYKAILNNGLDVQEQFDHLIINYYAFIEYLRKFFDEIEACKEISHLDECIKRLINEWKD